MRKISFLEKIFTLVVLVILVVGIFQFSKEIAFAQTCEKGEVVCPNGQMPCCDKFKPHCKDGEAKCCKKKKDGSGLKCQDKEGNTYPVQCKDSCDVSNEGVNEPDEGNPGTIDTSSEDIGKENTVRELVAPLAPTAAPAPEPTAAVCSGTTNAINPSCSGPCDTIPQVCYPDFPQASTNDPNTAGLPSCKCGSYCKYFPVSHTCAGPCKTNDIPPAVDPSKWCIFIDSTGGQSAPSSQDDCKCKSRCGTKDRQCSGDCPSTAPVCGANKQPPDQATTCSCQSTCSKSGNICSFTGCPIGKICGSTGLPSPDECSCRDFCQGAGNAAQCGTKGCRDVAKKCKPVLDPNGNGMGPCTCQ